MTTPDKTPTQFSNSVEVSRIDTGLFVKNDNITLSLRQGGDINGQKTVHIRGYDASTHSAMDMVCNLHGDLITVRKLDNVPAELAVEVTNMLTGIDDAVSAVTNAGNTWKRARSEASDCYSEVFATYFGPLGDEATDFIKNSMGMSGFPSYTKSELTN